MTSHPIRHAFRAFEVLSQIRALDTREWSQPKPRRVLLRNQCGFVSKRSIAKAFAKDVFIDQERKLGDRRRSDTVVVLTINHADQRLEVVSFMTPSAPYEESKFLGSGRSMVTRLKLKGIDGRALPGVKLAA